VGKRSLVKTIPAGQEESLELEIDVSSFAAGVYYISAETDLHRAVKTMVVLH